MVTVFITRRKVRPTPMAKTLSIDHARPVVWSVEEKEQARGKVQRTIVIYGKRERYATNALII